MNYKYLILGGGMAADRAVRGIRSRDASSSIGIISREPFPCYERPPLSKGLWTGSAEDSIWRRTEEESVTFHLEETVLQLDPAHRMVKTDRSIFHYEKLLVATGVSPQKLDCPAKGVIYLHDFQDYKKLRALYNKSESFIVVGSGYIGSEIAAALAMNGKRVTMVFPGPAIYHRKVPKGFANFLNAYYTEKGVQLKPNQIVTAVEQDGMLFHVTLSSGERLTVDGVVAGIGCTPNLDFASTLKMENGIEVNEYLQSSDPHIFAAGDCANVFYPLVQKRLRIEHEDAANAMGFTAGENMAGAHHAFTYQPYFYSELFELGYEAVGLLGQDFEVVECWDEQYRKGTLYYCQGGHVCGAMLWGIWDEVERIRDMIRNKAAPPAAVK